MLTDVCQAMINRLRLVPGIGQAPDFPPAQLSADRTLLVYPIPGSSTPAQHSGRGGAPVYQNADTVVVEWHLKIQADHLEQGVEESTRMTDALRDAIWSEFLRNRFGNTVIGITSIDTQMIHDLVWNREHSFGVRLTVSLTHLTEIAAP